MRLRTITTAAMIAALAAACANAPAAGGGPAGGGIDHPTAADQLVLRVETGGGFVPVEFLFTQIPGFSLYGDGRAIATGAQIEIFPPPALPPLIQTPLSEEGVQAILRAAIDAGLETARDLSDFGQTMIADASTTTFTLTVNGATHTTTVYALGELSEKPPGMSADEYETRRDLLAFSQRLGDIRSWLPNGSVGEDAPFQPSSMRLFISGYRADEQLPQRAIEWPLTQGLGGFGAPVEEPVVEGTRCGTVDGEGLASLLPEAERANQLTPWTSGDEEFQILFRPLLPDEGGCGSI